MICEIITCIGVIVLLSILILTIIKIPKKKKPINKSLSINGFYQPVVGSTAKGMVWNVGDGTYYTLTLVRSTEDYSLRAGVWIKGQNFNEKTKISIQNIIRNGQTVRAWILGADVPFILGTDNSIMVIDTPSGFDVVTELYYNMELERLAYNIGGLTCLRATNLDMTITGFPPLAQLQLITRDPKKQVECDGASQITFHDLE